MSRHEEAPGAEANLPGAQNAAMIGEPSSVSTIAHRAPVRLSRAVHAWLASLPRQDRRRLMGRMRELGELDRLTRERGTCPAPPTVPPVGGER